MKCFECDAEMQITRQDVSYDECGLAGILLKDVEVRRCPECGAEEVCIPHLENLHQAISFVVANKPTRLSGPEVRFLRTALGFSQVDAAAELGVSAEHLSRVEHDKNDLGPSAERLLRLMVFLMEPKRDYGRPGFQGIKERGPLSAALEYRSNEKTWEPLCA